MADTPVFDRSRIVSRMIEDEQMIRDRYARDDNLIKYRHRAITMQEWRRQARKEAVSGYKKPAGLTSTG